MTVREMLTGLVVIDEVQRAPDLFPLLRVLADRRPLPGRFFILGSAVGLIAAPEFREPRGTGGVRAHGRFHPR